MNNRIRILREARGLSLELLASSIGTTNQQISLLESGKRRLTVEWLVRLAGALSCHPWEVVAQDLPDKVRPEDLRLLERFRRLTKSQQTALLEFLDATASSGARRRPAASG